VATINRDLPWVFDVLQDTPYDFCYNAHYPKLVTFTDIERMCQDDDCVCLGRWLAMQEDVMPRLALIELLADLRDGSIVSGGRVDLSPTARDVIESRYARLVSARKRQRGEQ
jgi:hypothetical protein